MPPYYENAAQLLQILIGRGVTIEQGVNPHDVIMLLAVQCFAAIPQRQKFSHADQALSTLTHLEKKRLIRFEIKRRQKLVALIGTAIANHRAA